MPLFVVRLFIYSFNYFRFVFLVVLCSLHLRLLVSFGFASEFHLFYRFWLIHEGYLYCNFLLFDRDVSWLVVGL